MATQTVEALVEGGKASAAPPLGPALGPLGVNIGQVIAKINEKTGAFKGMQVPIKVTVDTATKTFDVSVGTPPASALIKKEAGVEKGSGNPKLEKIANIKIEQIIKIAKMKEGSLMGKTMTDRVKEVLGTCFSMGIMVEGKAARDTIRDVEAGMFAEEIKLGKTELTAEELKEVETQRKQLEEELKAKRASFEATAKSIIAAMVGKPRGTIKAKLIESGIPTSLIEELLPVEAAGAAAAPGAAAPKKEEGKKDEKKK
ncbi:50S ribosomal protein L11 [Candidatus Woesearchaeota archaeon]|nr:50S ribosomal protein L11 [Candidatus Woesearchaeota archaeon]